MVLSTLRVHDELVAAGMPEAQARAVVRVIERQQEDAATKTDLANLETRLFARLESLIWRATAVTCGLMLVMGGIIIGAIAAFD